MKKLIVTAHDYGLCQSVNEGILWCLRHPNNVITDVSLIPNAIGSEDAAQRSAQIDVGISLNTTFTTGKPLSNDVPSLVDQKGNFRSVDIANWDFSNLNHYQKEDVQKELSLQWDWFVQRLSRKPDALLNRKNEFADPLLLEVFVGKAKAENVPIRTPVWQWRSNYAAQSYVHQSGVKHTNEVYIGLQDWKDRFGYNLEQDIERLVNDINNSDAEISELIVFPGFVDEELFAQSSINWQRGQFLKVLQKGALTTALKEHFQLISYRDI